MRVGKPVIRFTLAVVLLVLLVLLGVQFGARPLLKGQLDRYLEANASDVYAYSYESLGVNPFGGVLSIKNVEITPTAAAFDSLRQGVYEDIDQLSTRQFRLDFDLFAYLLGRNVVLNAITLYDPDIRIFYLPRDSLLESSNRQRDPVVAQEFFSEQFKSFHLDELRVQNASFLLHNIQNDQPDFQLDSVNVFFTEAHISPATIEESPLGLEFEKLSVQTGDFQVDLNEYYHLSTKQIWLNVTTVQSDSAHKEVSLDINGVSYWPKEESLQRIANGEIRTLTGMRSKEVVLEDFSIEDLVLGKRLRLAAVKILEPEMRQYVNTRMNKETKRSSEDIELEDVVTEISIDLIQLKRGSMTITDVHKSLADLNVSGVEMEFHGVLFNDSTDQHAPMGVQFDRGDIHFDSTFSDLGDYYSVETEKVDLSLTSGDLDITAFHLVPKYSPERFSQIHPFETDHFDVSAQNISLSGVDMGKLVRNLSLDINHVAIDELSLDVYRDKWLPDPEFKYKPLPSRSIRELAIPLWIDSLTAKRSYVRYRQLGDLVEYEDEEPGAITFNDLYISSYNITNNRNYLQENPLLVLDARAMFMGKHPLVAQYRLNILDTLDTFHVTGHVGDVPASDLDPVLKPLLLVEVPGGDIQSLDIDMTGNDNVMSGTIQMQYEGLYVNVLKTKKPTKSSGFLNTLGNNVIRHRNLKTRGRFVTGLVNAERKKNKSIFNFTWGGIKSGIISTVVPFAKKAGKERAEKTETGEN